MKRRILLFLLVGVASLSFAQKKEVQNAYYWIQPNHTKLDKAKIAIDKATEYPGTANFYKTWYYRGLVYHKLYMSKKPEIKSLAEEPLMDAAEAYMKYLEIDDKARFEGPAKKSLGQIANLFFNDGVKAFNDEEYDKAIKYFQQTLKINKLPFINRVDNEAVYQIALCADKSGKYDMAEEYYQKALDNGFGNQNVYIFLANVQKAKGDTTLAISTLENGIDKFPEENINIINELIKFFVMKGEVNKGIEYVNMAIEKDSGNALLYNIVGGLYESIDDVDNAVASYKKAIEIKPDYKDALYYLGAIYYNKAAAQTEAANEIPFSEKEKYDAAVAKANELFESAMPYFEKFHELDSTDMNAMKTLKTIYYRLKLDDKHAAMTEKMKK